MKRCILAMIIIILLVLTGAAWKYFFSPDLGGVVGKLNMSSIEKIALIAHEKEIEISDPDEIRAILNCFHTDIFAVTGSYDWLATGGCGGYHWDTEFRIELIGGGHEAALYFDDCDAPHQHEISEAFIVWTVDPNSRVFYTKTGCRFLLGGYDLQGLSANVGQYIDVMYVY